MQRLRLLLLPLLALVALAGTSAPAQAKSSIRVGVGDQSPLMFDSADWKALGVKTTRYFFPWNGMKDPYQVTLATQFLQAARAHDVSVLLHFSTDDFALKKAKLPSVAAYTAQLKKAVPYFRSLGVNEWGVWNEANHASQPTYRNPKRAADFFKALYGVVGTKDKIVALDVLDQGGVDTYEKRFFTSLSPTFRKRVKYVGLHNYSDVNRGSSTYTAKMIKAARHYSPKAKFWFTETGGIVEFGKTFKCSTSRAASRVKNVFTLAKKFASQGVQRVYLYNWYGSGCGETRQDVGLVDPNGKPRAAYKTVKKQLSGFSK